MLSTLPILLITIVFTLFFKSYKCFDTPFRQNKKNKKQKIEVIYSGSYSQEMTVESMSLVKPQDFQPILCHL